MIIYHTAVDRTPYTYYIRWDKLCLQYYGRRTAKNCHPSEFFISYFTSSKYVDDAIAEFGEIVKLLEQGVSKKEISELVGVKMPYISKIKCRHAKWISRTDSI